ncbi:flagellar hook-associated protein FlgK [Halanaerobium saccharolyticum]|uniref:flagellar hook-associated protein FlgK n=1 Tax=Halanaerobium saccharolyticum TaxID=43595 RepID=UPI003FCC676D
MNNIFSGLHVGLRALETQRKSLDVTGHNIANANNEDYNKQRAIHKASYPYTAPGLSNHGGAGQFGTGVEIEQVERVKDQFINSQIFQENQSSAYWTEMERGLEKVEYIMNEPSDSGIDTAINQFWNSLQDLSNNPSDNAARNMVRENAYNLIDSFQSVENQLTDYKESINENLSNAAADINNITTKMADLNKQIVSVKGSGQNPNDLIDRRDGLYKDLSSLINVQSREDEQGNLIVSTNGLQIVNGSDAYELETKGNTDDNSIPRNQDKLIHSRTGTEIEATNGKIAAWMEMRDEKLDFYSGRLNKLAETMVTKFNEKHKEGYDATGAQGGNFFVPKVTGSDQSVIEQLDLTEAIKNLETGLSKIAAGTEPAAGNGENANELSNIFNTVEATEGTDLEGASLEGYFRTIVTSVGAESSRSQQMKNNQDVVLKQLNTLDRSVSGVSLDEEMANLIKYQQSYAAAAKYINKTDQLLETLMTIV